MASQEKGLPSPKRFPTLKFSSVTRETWPPSPTHRDWPLTRKKKPATDAQRCTRVARAKSPDHSSDIGKEKLRLAYNLSLITLWTSVLKSRSVHSTTAWSQGTQGTQGTKFFHEKFEIWKIFNAKNANYTKIDWQNGSHVRFWMVERLIVMQMSSESRDDNKPVIFDDKPSLLAWETRVVVMAL